MSLRFIHVMAYIRILILFRPKKYSTIWLDHVWKIHLPVDGHWLLPPFACVQSLSPAQLSATPWTGAHLCPWNSPDKNTGVGGHSLLQGFFPIQGSNPGLLWKVSCIGREIFYCCSTWEVPKIVDANTYCRHFKKSSKGKYIYKNTCALPFIQ